MTRTPKGGPKVLFEDATLLVLDKPAGLVVHPAPSHHGPTLVDWLKEYLGPKALEIFAEPERVGLVHRLDKDTSGVLVVTKTPAAKTIVGKQFHDRIVKKEYDAFIEGVPPRKTGIISAPVGRSRQVPSRMAITGNGRPSETSFEVAEKWKEAALVKLYPKTGRTHQLRVHCAAIGHPIVGDHTYGCSAKWEKTYGITRPLLHARRIELDHPVTAKRVAFEAPWPADMKKALVMFRRSAKAATAAMLLISLMGVARADDSDAKPTRSRSSSSSSSASSGSSSGSTSTASTARALRKEMASMREQFKSLITEVSAVQDKVTAIQTSLDDLGASRRFADLEKALSDLNAKAVNSGNTSDETKSAMMDVTRKIKAQQDVLDQLRDQLDRLQREVIQVKARADSPPPPPPPVQGSGR